MQVPKWDASAKKWDAGGIMGCVEQIDGLDFSQYAPATELALSTIFFVAPFVKVEQAETIQTAYVSGVRDMIEAVEFTSQDVLNAATATMQHIIHLCEFMLDINDDLDADTQKKLIAYGVKLSGEIDQDEAMLALRTVMGG